jgi:putative ABC transport system permease protein
MRAAEEELRTLFRQRHRVAPNEPETVSIRNMAEVAATRDASARTLSTLLAAVAAVSLLVGGIGVMNIMLVSVTERTREIGIRKALGARRFDIVLQFLMEAMALTGLGGVVGIVFSIGVTLLVNALVPSLPSEVPSWAVIAGFTVSVMIGLFFGVWPAMKAARLDPVEALRYE